MEGISRVTITPVEFVEVTRKFAFHCPAHGLQLFLYFTPYSILHLVRVGACERVNKVL